MKTVALVLLSLAVLAQAETESPITFIEGFIRGLQPDTEDNSACRIAYGFIQTTGITTIQNFANAASNLADGVRAFENIIRTMEYTVSAIENCNFEENLAQMQNVFAGPGLVTSLTLMLSDVSATGTILQSILSAIRQFSWEQAGIAMGQFMKTYFNFSVESI